MSEKREVDTGFLDQCIIRDLDQCIRTELFSDNVKYAVQSFSETN